MSLIEKRSPSIVADYGGADDGMPATMSICVALVVALLLYVGAAAALQRGTVTAASQQAVQFEMSFHGP